MSTCSGFNSEAVSRTEALTECHHGDLTRSGSHRRDCSAVRPLTTGIDCRDLSGDAADLVGQRDLLASIVRIAESTGGESRMLLREDRALTARPGTQVRRAAII